MEINQLEEENISNQVTGLLKEVQTKTKELKEVNNNLECKLTMLEKTINEIEDQKYFDDLKLTELWEEYESESGLNAIQRELKYELTRLEKKINDNLEEQLKRLKIIRGL